MTERDDQGLSTKNTKEEYKREIERQKEIGRLKKEGTIRVLTETSRRKSRSRRKITKVSGAEIVAEVESSILSAQRIAHNKAILNSTIQEEVFLADRAVGALSSFGTPLTGQEQAIIAAEHDRIKVQHPIVEKKKTWKPWGKKKSF